MFKQKFEMSFSWFDLALIFLTKGLWIIVKGMMGEAWERKQ